jgi:predicted  nucleic acid-binding Zn-ribbon protein
MTADDKTIALFTTRVRQLLIQYEQLKEENKRLREELEKCNDAISDMESKLSSTQDDYHSLMTAKMLEITEGDMEAAKARLNKLIRSVNKCITLLSEQ